VGDSRVEIWDPYRESISLGRSENGRTKETGGLLGGAEGDSEGWAGVPETVGHQQIQEGREETHMTR